MWHHRFVSNHSALAASLAACLISAAACSSEEPPAQKEAELIEDWLHPTCAASGLLPPAPDTCAGPWSFGYRDLTRSVELCGTGQCVQHKSCTSWHRDSHPGVADGSPEKRSSATVMILSGRVHS